MVTSNRLKVEDKVTTIRDVPLTKDVNEILSEHVKEEPELAVAILFEVLSVFINGEAVVARLMLRNLVNATIGFEALSAEIDKPSKSLHRMLSAKGNPTMDNLAAIISAMKKYLNVGDMEVKSVSGECDEPLQSV